MWCQYPLYHHHSVQIGIFALNTPHTWYFSLYFWYKKACKISCERILSTPSSEHSTNLFCLFYHTCTASRPKISFAFLHIYLGILKYPVHTHTQICSHNTTKRHSLWKPSLPYPVTFSGDLNVEHYRGTTKGMWYHKNHACRCVYVLPCPMLPTSPINLSKCRTDIRWPNHHFIGATLSTWVTLACFWWNPKLFSFHKHWICIKHNTM